MNRLQTFEQFLKSGSAEISLISFVTNLLIAAVLGFVLGRIYVRYGNALSNRRMFARNDKELVCVELGNDS